MVQYNKLADIYDYLVSSVDYQEWLKYIQDLALKHHLKIATAADLACGTGNTTIPLAKAGYEVYGIDLSTQMLEKAREKAVIEGVKAEFIEQNMIDLELPKPVDLIVCYHDGLNYITKFDDLKQLFKRVEGNLKNDGLFIFDLVAVEKLARADGSTTFIEDEVMDLVYETKYIAQENLWEIQLVGYVKKEQGYEKFKEVHQEKAHNHDEIMECLTGAGLQLEGVYHSYSFEPPHQGTRRAFYVARKI
jgi:predicted TPR repeat methyltransferase